MDDELYNLDIQLERDISTSYNTCHSIRIHLLGPTLAHLCG